MTACILPTANATMTATAGMAALVRGESVLPTGFAATPDRWLYSADSTQPKKEKPKRSKNRSLFVLEVRVSRLLAGQSIYEDVPPVRPPCSAGYLDCNGMPNDGCETHANSCSP
jgi:hypothetical protein